MVSKVMGMVVIQSDNTSKMLHLPSRLHPGPPSCILVLATIMIRLLFHVEQRRPATKLIMVLVIGRLYAPGTLPRMIARYSLHFLAMAGMPFT